MKVTAPDDFGFTVATGGPVAKGEEIEVDAETGARLVEQGWTSAVAKAAKRTARKRVAKAAKRTARKRKARAKTEDVAPEPDESEAVPDTEPPADAVADTKKETA